jgi:hypothetical protein
MNECDSPPTQSRSIGSGGESSNLLTTMEGMQYRRFEEGIISYLIVLHSVGGLVSMMFTHPMLNFNCQVADYYALYTIVHYTLLYTFHCYIHEEFI